MPYEKIKNILRQSNLRPTKQRIAIFDILFRQENWHFSADIVEKNVLRVVLKFLLVQYIMS